MILGSSIGEDAALIALNDSVLVLKTDPVTGTSADIGWWAVHINANDVASRGARPRWFLCDLLLPDRTSPATVDRIMSQVSRAARQVGAAVVGGHSEVTPNLKRPIIVGYMVGLVRRGGYVTSRGARPGDRVIMTKTAGIEGTAILASDFARKLRGKITRQTLIRAQRMSRQLSVVKDATIALRVGGVRAMHDPTEGGLLQGLWELAEASKVGFHVHESAIPISPETKSICSTLKVNPLRLLSSGCLLIAADRQRSKRIVRRLEKKRIRASIIGAFTDKRKGRRLVRLSGEELKIGPLERDELYRVIEKHRPT